MGTIQTIASYIINLINTVIVPFVFAIAFAMFLFGVFQFYFLKGADAKARGEGRGFIIGGIVAFAVMVSVWGLVNLVTGSIPFLSNNQPSLPGFTTSGTNSTQGQTPINNNTSTQGQTPINNNTSTQGQTPQYPGDNGNGKVAPANPNSSNSDYGDLQIQSAPTNGSKGTDPTNSLY